MPYVALIHVCQLPMFGLMSRYVEHAHTYALPWQIPMAHGSAGCAVHLPARVYGTQVQLRCRIAWNVF